jgi:hypothetical protein
MLSLSEDAFDQDLSNGGGGWRKVASIPGCEAAAADLIAAYRAQHESSTTLLWHEGQLRAFAGQTERAIPLLLESKHDPATDLAGWNDYVDATVAFLRRDREALLSARDRLAARPYPSGEGMPPLVGGMMEVPTQPGQPPMRVRWPPNIDVVDGLVACFERSYKEAYSGRCRSRPPSTERGRSNPSRSTPNPRLHGMRPQASASSRMATPGAPVKPGR